jgi:hypothetical protein
MNFICNSLSTGMLGGYNNCIIDGDCSSIIGGCYNIVKRGPSTILGGAINTLDSYVGTIVGGRCNLICDSGNTGDSLISSGFCNVIMESPRSIIMGGYKNSVNSSTSSIILDGCCNLIQCNGVGESTIINGHNNTIQYDSNSSSIVGGQCNLLECNSCNSVIVGGSNLSLCNECNIVYVPELKVSTVSNDDALTKVLVWDEGSTNKMKWRDVTTIGGGGLISTQCGVFYGYYSVIVGGACNTSCGAATNNRNSILGGYCNKVDSATFNTNSSIIGGLQNCVDKTINVFIGGGECNCMCCAYSTTIIGGFSNNISNYSQGSSIISGLCNLISNNDRGIILGGSTNLLQDLSSNSSIIGGYCNTLEYSSQNSAIIGGSNLSLCNECNIVYVPELKVATASNDDTLNKVLVWDDGSSYKMKWRNLSVLGINSQSTSYTLVLSDEGKVIDITSGSNETLTVPQDSSVAFPNGTQLVVIRSGTGDLGITGGGLVTVNSAQGYLNLNYQYSAATLIKLTTDNWYVFGDLKP